MKIGILALQGAFSEHQVMLEKLGAETVQVRLSRQLAGVDALIIPGGESTTIGKLAVDFGMLDDLIDYGKSHPVWGTCAGAIFLSKDAHRSQPLLGLMDITTERNAFGRQVDSFETDLNIAALNTNGRPFHAVFIRAPLIKSVGEGVQILAALPDGRIVAARQNQWLATSFHPELTNDDRFHRYFMEMVLSK
ncbi:MAG: pyridoxal 5'-phosphate synthase glutaminase subunit PdxT [Chloroflexi bacterium HGW-Chloroflexi-10]|jgi:5'-phosphate synthase pdxT subunit|nr:MAG: pyridoxal 5'-phosphate synthase glutaminase subunit PdxT [Chloroflexi bacterium HGW-Chloroflexi-10]